MNPSLQVTSVAATGGAGDGRLERITLRDRERGATEEVAADALYVMIGARPQTGWLEAAPSPVTGRATS